MLERTNHCTNFAQAVLQRTERDHLLGSQGATKQEFIRFLEDSLVERDFREICYSVAKLCD